MSKRLDDLKPDMRALAVELIARCAEDGDPVFIADTLRTAEEHAANLARGTSWTPHSRHLDGDAIDVVPYLQFQAHGPDKLNWNADDPVWQRIGRIGESLGLRWGGRWKQRDMGHFEIVRKANGQGAGG